MRWIITNIILLFNTSNSIFFPASLNGKRILMNGPAETPGKSTTFDGDGIITVSYTHLTLPTIVLV